MLSFEPCPIDIMMMTAATPMMMPSMERKERILLLATAMMLTLNRLSMFIVLRLLVVLRFGQCSEGFGCRLDVVVDGVFSYLAVSEVDVARGVFGYLRVVGDEDDGVSFFV